MQYIRPIPLCDPAEIPGSLALAGGWCRFVHAEVLERGRSPVVVPASELSKAQTAALVSGRGVFGGVTMDRPRIMGILNVTPDSFSDGGLFDRPDTALMAARRMAADADILDIGGESTRPGAAEVAVVDEIARTAPVIAAMRNAGIVRPISIDTRKADVAAAALVAGAGILNDVSAMTFDPAMARLMAAAGAPVILMHSVGDPQIMQNDPRYGDVLLDVYDALSHRIAEAEAAGIARSRIAIDPGIGFGKTLAHNLALLSRLSLFHSLGLPILLGASRKRFIGTLSGEDEAARRMPGSVAVALGGVAQGVQMIRVHDVAETRQALQLWQATNRGANP
jgi:dihydropteroate synthase